MPQYIYIDLKELLTCDSISGYLSKQFDVNLPYSQNLDALYDKITEKRCKEVVVIQISPKSYLLCNDRKINKTLKFLNKISRTHSHFQIRFERD